MRHHLRYQRKRRATYHRQKKFDTTTVDETIDRILCETEKMMNLHQLTPTNTKAIGICCGGPLNSETGIVMSP